MLVRIEEKINTMENIKINFLNKTSILSILKNLDEKAKPKWGNLTPQHMVEHLSSTIRYSNGKTKHKLYIPKEHLEKYQSVLFADQDFPKFFKSPVFKKDLPKLNTNSTKEATKELLTEIEIFKSRFSGKEDEREMHPIFGELNYKEWLIYHNKHFQHHFKQFNLMKE